MRTALRFCLLALPGALLMFVIGPGWIAPAMGPDLPPRAIRVAGGIAAIVIGAAMILIGVNQWRKWLYVLPLFAVIAFLLAWDANMHRAVLLMLLLLPFVLAAGVRAYYARH